MIQYKKLQDLPKRLEQLGVDSPLSSDLSEESIKETITKVENEWLDNTLVDLTPLKSNEDSIHFNLVTMAIPNTSIKIVYEATYEEYDPEFEVFQYTYTTPVGWIEEKS